MKSTDDAGMKKLYHHMNNYFSRSMSTGIFAKKIADAASSVQSTNLKTINFPKLETMRVVLKSTSDKKSSIIANAVIIASAMMGIGFSFLTYRSVMQQANDDYDFAMGESQHEETDTKTDH